MSLIITFMLEPAKLQMNWASASGTSTWRGGLGAGPRVPVPGPVGPVGTVIVWPPIAAARRAARAVRRAPFIVPAG